MANTKVLRRLKFTVNDLTASEHDIAHLALKLESLMAERDTIKDALAEHRKEAKEAITAADDSIAKIRYQLQSGMTDREVDATEIAYYDEGIARIHDEKGEILSKRFLDKSEFQEVIPEVAELVEVPEGPDYFTEGVTAAAEGKSDLDCPYEIGGAGYEKWISGWESVSGVAVEEDES